MLKLLGIVFLVLIGLVVAFFTWLFFKAKSGMEQHARVMAIEEGISTTPSIVLEPIEHHSLAQPEAVAEMVEQAVALGATPCGNYDAPAAGARLCTYALETPPVYVVIYDHEDQTCHRRGTRLGCGKFERGDLVYYVIYSGEGFVRVLHDGAEKIVDDPHRLLGDCRFASRRCWVTSLAPASTDQAVVDDQLWVEIQRVDGSKVWTNEIALHSAYEEVDPDPERRKRRQELAAECAKN